MSYQHLIDKDVDLSAVGYGDSLTFEYDASKGLLRISIFGGGHYQDHVVLDLAYELGNRKDDLSKGESNE